MLGAANAALRAVFGRFCRFWRHAERRRRVSFEVIATGSPVVEGTLCAGIDAVGIDFGRGIPCHAPLPLDREAL
ncbi:hypothetical protein BV392_09750 [Rhodovulum sulfidophilum]|nr:hypothetical protein BV392_09750 [Rhodovulum sulfidophilum]